MTADAALWPLTEANDGRCRCGRPAYDLSAQAAVPGRGSGCEWHAAVAVARLRRLDAADLGHRLPDTFLRAERRYLQDSIEGVPDLYWARWYDRRCAARVEPNPTGMHGRCELRARHRGDHALERGMDTPRWSTAWTA